GGAGATAAAVVAGLPGGEIALALDSALACGGGTRAKEIRNERAKEKGRIGLTPLGHKAPHRVAKNVQVRPKRGVCGLTLGSRLYSAPHSGLPWRKYDCRVPREPSFRRGPGARRRASRRVRSVPRAGGRVGRTGHAFPRRRRGYRAGRRDP